MRLDHIAYRVADRYKTAKFFVECFGYRFAEDLPDGFEIEFEDHSKAKCLVMVPPEKIETQLPIPWASLLVVGDGDEKINQEYHVAPEIFISDGTEGSIVKDWVLARNGVGGIHHLAYQVASVEEVIEEWTAKGFAEFTTDEPLKCDGLTQIFTKPSELTGVIYEFIKRDKQGFCQENVKDLMNSTKGLSQ